MPAGMRALLIALGLLVVAGGAWYVATLRAELTALRAATSPQKADAPAPRPAQTGTGMSSLPRSLTSEQRQAMLDVLRGETGSVRKVWFQVELDKTEPAAFQKELAAVFREAGWEVETIGSQGMTFKPGIYVLAADEEWAPYAETALEAFDKAGLEVKAARGYRAYYQEQRASKPDWRGPQLRAEQTYVVLVGAQPAG
jgi:hypothetical protein